MDLIDRKYRILQAIIDDYIMTALPVGSRTISRKYEQKLSSATIRNEMSDLEELGYLDSPHTSAGRIPSYKAYRLYVDRMIHPMPLSEEETAFIKGCFDHRINQVEELSARIAKALSSMTHYTTAVMTRAPREEQVFSHLQLVPVSDRRLLLVIVTRSGAVRQTVIDTEKPIAPDALYTVSQIISRELEGCAMDQLPARLTRLAGGQEREMRELLGLLAAQPPEKDGGVGSLVVGGRSNLLSFPEYADVDRAKELLSAGKGRLPSLPSGGDGNLRSYRPGNGHGRNEGLLHRHGELSLKRRNGQHDRPDRPDPDAIRQGVVGAGRGWPLDHGAAGRAE